MRLKLFILTSYLLPFTSYLLFAANVGVSVDENGTIQPAAARDAIALASSAAVKVDLATARAEILTNVQHIAIGMVEEASAILNSRTDYAIVQLTAAGVKDALSATNTASEGRIEIVDNVVVDRASDPDNTLVTLTWQYVAGSFSEPRILASASVDTNAYEAVTMTEPVQIEWGTNFAFRATATLPNASYGVNAFFKVAAKPDAPVDDGKVFDIFSDGTDMTIDLIPSRRYRVRVISGRITSITLVE